MSGRKNRADLRNSGYLRGWRPARSKLRRRCFYCGRPMHSAPNCGGTMTDDHIIPAAYRTERHKDIVLKRPCCSECNGLRNSLEHCVGALMIVVQLADQRGADKTTTAELMGFFAKRKIQKNILSGHMRRRAAQSRIFLNTYLAA